MTPCWLADGKGNPVRVLAALQFPTLEVTEDDVVVKVRVFMPGGAPLGLVRLDKVEPFWLYN